MFSVYSEFHCVLFIMKEYIHSYIRSIFNNNPDTLTQITITYFFLNPIKIHIYSYLSPHSARKVMAKVLVKTRNILTHFLPNQDFSRKLKDFLLGWLRSVSMLSVLIFSASWEWRPSCSCGSAFRLGSEPLLYSEQWSYCHLIPHTLWN